MRDLVHRLSVNQSIRSTAVTNGNTATNGTGVSILGYESVTGVMRLSAYTDGNYTPSLQVSADNVNFYALDATGYIGGAAPGAVASLAAAPAGDTVFGILQLTSVAANTAGVANTALIYARVVVTQAGGTSGATFQADIILGFPRHSGVAV